jgi:hemerythrin-like domain-containing protein
MGKISEFMLKEHGQILALLNKFEKSKAEEDFKTLKTKQENHMMAEEKAIFIFDKKHKIFPVLATIMEQHEQLEKDMEEIQNNMEKDTVDYKKLMKDHVSLEDREFYPLLDKKLSSEEQKEMLTKAKEYILGNVLAQDR